MEYTVNKLAQLAGISTRTLRYYDSIGLLRPARVSSNGYRIYGKNEVDKLQQINETLKAAMETGNPAGELAQKVCGLHKQWICMFWKEGMYSKAAHKGLGELYATDERFKAYYDKIAPGTAVFLRDALNVYCAE